MPAAVVIEGHDTHTRTGFIDISPEMLRAAGAHEEAALQVPVTHAKVFGWYDNEYGSYVTSLGKLATYVHQSGAR